MNDIETKSDKPKISLSTKLLAIALMLFILLLVTILIPRNNIIGICLQTLAGLVFIIQQMWNKVVDRDTLTKLNNLLDEQSFQQKLPFPAIIIITPILVVAYYKFSGTDREWYDVLLSILLAVGFANLFYFYFITLLSKWLQRIGNSKRRIATQAHMNPYLWSNLIVVTVSFALFIVAIILLFPLSKLSGHPILVTILAAGYLTALMIVLYGFLLSFLYFILYGFIKFIVALRRIRFQIGTSDKEFIKRITWTFILISWLWGGVLLIIDMWSK